VRWALHKQFLLYKQKCGTKSRDDSAWRRFSPLLRVPLAEKQPCNYYTERGNITSCKTESIGKHGNSHNHKISRGNPCFRIMAYCLTTRVILQLRTVAMSQWTTSLNAMRVCWIQHSILLLDWQGRRVVPLGLLEVSHSEVRCAIKKFFVNKQHAVYTLLFQI
jgi:hypothetical protein